MPSPDMTALSPRLVRLVLVLALGGGLGGLALPSGATATPSAPLTQAEAAALHVPVLSPPAVIAKPAKPVRRAPRATRHAHRTPQFVRPVGAGVVSAYGMRWGRMHKGVDFGSSYGAAIRAVGDGRVLGAGYLAEESGYGKIVLIRHASGAVTAYAHMSKVLVSAGDRVQAGDVVGQVGSTGHSTGPHLHFEVRVGGSQVNPLRWLRRHGVSV